MLQIPVGPPSPHLPVEFPAATTHHCAELRVATSRAAAPRPELPPGYASNNPEARHQSLPRCLDWSYERLDAATQGGFTRLGLFAIDSPRLRRRG